MELSTTGLQFIANFEGLMLDAYKDIVGVATIGYGHTRNVKMGDKVTATEALILLREDAHEAIKDVRRLVKVSLTQGQFDALVSFTFNLGGGALERSTLLRMLNEKNYEGARMEFHKWNKAGGREVSGLTRRRKAEADLFG
jgi:lysozyme